MQAGPFTRHLLKPSSKSISFPAIPNLRRPDNDHGGAVCSMAGGSEGTFLQACLHLAGPWWATGCQLELLISYAGVCNAWLRYFLFQAYSPRDEPMGRCIRECSPSFAARHTVHLCDTGVPCLCPAPAFASSELLCQETMSPLQSGLASRSCQQSWYTVRATIRRHPPERTIVNLS